MNKIQVYYISPDDNARGHNFLYTSVEDIDRKYILSENWKVGSIIFHLKSVKNSCYIFHLVINFSTNEIGWLKMYEKFSLSFDFSNLITDKPVC